MKRLSKRTLVVMAALLGSMACSKDDGVQLGKQIKWDFASTDDWTTDNQGDDEEKINSSVVNCTDCSDKKALRIYTQANTRQRQKMKTKKRFGAGLYTWRTYISDLSKNERASIGSWIWHNDKHELDFEVGSGPEEERRELKVADDEVIAYITNQESPHLHKKVKIKKNAWHIFQIDLKLVKNNYFATWIIDGTEYASAQLEFGHEYPFHIFCSTENIKFVGDKTPVKDNYGLWDYVTYAPYSYSIAPKERK